MPEYWFSVTRIFQFKDRIVDYEKISVRENPYSGIFYVVVEKEVEEVNMTIHYAKPIPIVKRECKIYFQEWFL